MFERVREMDAGFFALRGANRLYRSTQSVLSRLIDRCYDVQIVDAGNVPSEPVILAANHRSFMDSLFIAKSVGRPVAFLAKAEYFERAWSRRLLTALGQIPLRRGSPTSARRALFAACEALAGGWSVAIYPEGTRSRDGMLHKGNTGVARLSCQAKVPILPVGILGTEAVQAAGQRRPRLFKPVTVRWGETIAPPAGQSAAELRDLTDNVMASIAALCEQEYDDHFAPIPQTQLGGGWRRSLAEVLPSGPTVPRFGPPL